MKENGIWISFMVWEFESGKTVLDMKAPGSMVSKQDMGELFNQMGPCTLVFAKMANIMVLAP